MKCICEMNKKEIEKNLTEIMTKVNKPKYLCRKCARAANEKKYVCKPVEIQVSKKKNK